MDIYILYTFIRRRFVKRFALCYQTVVLSVTLVCCGQTVGWIKMKLVVHVGLGPGHIVLDGDPATLPQKGAHICCGQIAAWIKMFAFSALTLLVVHQEEHPACKN